MKEILCKYVYVRQWLACEEALSSPGDGPNAAPPEGWKWGRDDWEIDAHGETFVDWRRACFREVKSNGG